MAEEAPSRGGVGTVTGALAGIGAMGAVANLVVFAAIGGAVFDGWPVETGALITGVAVVVAVIVAPAAAALGLVRVLRSRFSSVRVARTFFAMFALAQVGLAALGLTQSPEPVGELLALRGTWVVDAAAGRGPFGPAARDTALTVLSQARAAEDLEALTEHLSDETAGGLALHWLLILDGVRAPGDDGAAAALKGFAQGQKVDLAALRTDPASVDVSGRGRALLAAVADFVAGQGDELPPVVVEAAPVEWPELPDEPTVVVIDRTTLSYEAAGLEARFEDGAWRVHLGRADWARSARDRVERLEARVAVWELQRATEAARVGAIADAFTEVTGEAPPEDAAAAAAKEQQALLPVREAFEAAARGRLGWMAGTTAHDGSWPASLTRRAALRQAARVRAWCAQAGAGDGLVTAELEALSTRYGLGEVDAAGLEAKLTPRARAYLTDVLMVCAPVVVARQANDAVVGIDDARRARWASLDARALVEAATMTRNPDGVTIEADGRSWLAVEQDGAWRVDWAD